jgi:sensor c-di-GMP phosphodiesterase-like protein
MKFASHLTARIIVGVCITMALPVIAAIAIARNQAVEREARYIAGFARSALAIAEATNDQLVAGARQVNALPPEAVCSEQGIELLRRIDLSSTLLQAVGGVDGDIMRCSSFAGARPFNLGKADPTSPPLAAARTNVALIDSNTRYLTVSNGHFVGIIHKDLALSFVEQAPDLSVGVFTVSTRRPLLVRGPLSQRWITGDLTTDRLFRRGDHLVAIVRSKRYKNMAAVAAMPATATTGFVRDAALVLIPLGAIAGALLSYLLIRVLRTRFSMPAMIRQGLKAGEFRLHYQPVVDLKTGRAIGAEALLRWRRDDGSCIPPDVFIPVAEQAGIIGLVTARVLELLAADTRQVLRIAPDFHFAVNFAAADMHRPGVADEVTAFLAAAGLAPQNLVIEATERSLVDVDLARQTMRALRAIGIKVAIDDFGTGYSSLGYLAQLEIDFLKIDKLFVHALGTDSATSQVAARIIDMSKDLNLKIVAEGIETSLQAQLVTEMRVDRGQGFHFGRPMPIEDLLQHLRREKYSRPPLSDAA